jgi:NAD(P)-dependent dehydrogenase (short-subunit alcohol dehydrogenase family)
MKKTVLVTGHASGIGYYAAKQFHEGGFNVIGIDNTISAVLDKSIVQIRSDLSNWKEAEEAFAQIERVDYAVNCAGVAGTRKHILEITSEEIIQSYNAIFLPAFHACKLEIAKMVNNECVSKIINIASSTASVGGKNMVAYSSAKAAIVNLTKVCAIEYAPGIMVNSISPATIDTPMIRKKYSGMLPDYSKAYLTGHCGTVQDVWSAIKFLFDNNFMTGGDIIMDGGYSASFSLQLK